MVTELTDLTDQMKAAVGSTGPTVTYEVTTLGIRTFARAVGYRNPIYYDEAEAKEKGHPALVSPPGYYGMPVFNPLHQQARGPRASFDTPFKRNLNGGTEVEPLAPVYAGDVLEAVTTLANLTLTKGRMGQMLIQTSETVYTRKSDGKAVAKTRGTGISY
ncbi:MAG: MaoC family dehydratase N-terminal domain-containing protein [Dehalococcoidia bacterium]